MTVRFDTSEFEFSHGRAPRGRGSWAFSLVRDPDVTKSLPADKTGVLFTPSLTYGEAKMFARRFFRMQLCTSPAVTVYVQP